MKRTKRILILGTYPINRARHGGPIRVRALVDEYRRQSLKVKYVAVFSRWANPERALSDIPVSRDTDLRIIQQRELEDVICGQAIMDDPAVKARMTRLLKTYKPDIIQLEQIFPYLGLKPLLAELGLSPQIVMSTHNIEGPMKAEVYRQSKIEDGEALAQTIIDAEKALAKESTLAIAVSQDDADYLKNLGARDVLVARNGIDEIKPSTSAMAKWRQWLGRREISHSLLYVSSAHLPNWYGFKDTVGEALGFLRPDTKIIFAGALSEYLRKEYAKPTTPEALAFLRRSEFVGRLTDEQLDSLIDVADIILLPISRGGGSNLKTAEALASGKKIVGTTFAFRAFESYLDYPNIWIADTPRDFHRAINEAIAAPLTPRTSEQEAAVEDLYWNKCLKETAAKVSAL